MKALLEGLDVNVEITGIVADRWVQVDVSGEDEEIATKYISREVGFCPENVEGAKKFETLKGYIANPEDNKVGLTVDIGVFKPTRINAKVPLNHLQAQLVDGRSLELKTIVEIYGFSKDVPMSVKVKGLYPEATYIGAELATDQVLKYKLWIESLMDRLIVIGATSDEIHKALNYTGLKRDVVNVESLGIFEQALTCKLGTDAVGLISILGRKLRNAKFTPFNSRKTMESLISLKP